MHLPTGNPKINEIVERLSSSLDTLLADQTPSAGPAAFFHRSCNIVDPLQPGNNLGFSVSMITLSCIQHGLGEAYRHLCSIEDWERGDSHAVFTPSPRPSGAGNNSSSNVNNLKSSKNSNPNSPARMITNANGNASDNPDSTMGFEKSLSPVNPPPSLKIPTCDETDARLSLSPSKHLSDTWFIQTFFPNTLSLCGFGTCHRPDIVDHPCQAWNSVEPTRFSNEDEADEVLQNKSNLQCLRDLKEFQKEVERAEIARAEAASVGCWEEEKKCDLSPTKSNLDTATKAARRPVQPKKEHKELQSNKKKKSSGVSATSSSSQKRKKNKSTAKTAQQHKPAGVLSAMGQGAPNTTDSGTKVNANALWKAVALVSSLMSVFSVGAIFFGADFGEQAFQDAKVEDLNESGGETSVWVNIGDAITLGNEFEKGEGGDSRYSEYQWQKDNSDLLGVTDSFLRLTEINEDDEGIYSCLLKSDGVVLRRENVEIRVSQPPSVNNNAGYYKVIEGNKFLLSVSSTGMPPPDFQWRLNGVDVKGATKRNYVVEKMGLEDAGTYTCEVKNAAGTVLWEEAVVDVVGGRRREGQEEL